MASRRKPTAAKPTAYREVDCSNDDLSWSASLAQLVPLGAGLFAANCDFTHLAIIDASKSGAPRVLSTFKGPYNPYRLKFLPEWPALLAISDACLDVIDLSDPSAPRSTARFTYAVGHQRSGAFIGTDFYVTHENGVALLDPKSGKPKHLFDVPDDDFFKSYPTDLAVHGEHLYVVGRHSGLQVYQRTSRTSFTLLRSVKKGYTPTELVWWVPGQVLFMVGNEDLIAVDTSKPSEAKWQKACKIKRFELDAQVHRLSATEVLVAGSHLGTRSRFGLFTIDCSSPLAPVVSHTELINQKGVDFDSAHFALAGDQLIVGGTYLERLKVFTRSMPPKPKRK